MKKHHHHRRPSSRPPTLVRSSWNGDLDNHEWTAHLAAEIAANNLDELFGCPLQVSMGFALYSPRGMANHGPLPPFAQPFVGELVDSALSALEAGGIDTGSIAVLTVSRRLSNNFPGVFVSIRPVINRH